MKTKTRVMRAAGTLFLLAFAARCGSVSTSSDGGGAGKGGQGGTAGAGHAAGASGTAGAGTAGSGGGGAGVAGAGGSDGGLDGPACAPTGGGACVYCPNGYLTGPGGCATCSCKPGDAGVVADAAAEGPANPAGCPASYAATTGALCSSGNITCDYEEGRCACESCRGTDGGFASKFTCRNWDSGGAGCPARSPSVGSTCATAGQTCDYDGFCSVSVGDNLMCVNGHWQQEPSPLGTCILPSCVPTP
jgi:hypothetical protein